MRARFNVLAAAGIALARALMPPARHARSRAAVDPRAAPRARRAILGSEEPTPLPEGFCEGGLISNSASPNLPRRIRPKRSATGALRSSAGTQGTDSNRIDTCRPL
jgi:hypothetical protein